MWKCIIGCMKHIWRGRNVRLQGANPCWVRDARRWARLSCFGEPAGGIRMLNGGQSGADRHNKWHFARYNQHCCAHRFGLSHEVHIFGVLWTSWTWNRRYAIKTGHEVNGKSDTLTSWFWTTVYDERFPARPEIKTPWTIACIKTTKVYYVLLYWRNYSTATGPLEPSLAR